MPTCNYVGQIGRLGGYIGWRQSIQNMPITTPLTLGVYKWIMAFMVSREIAPFNLRRLAYDRIRDMLGRGKFPLGIRVSTQELAKQLGISRTPIREALSQLASQGLVRELPGFGIYVQLPDRQELEELYGMREVLESYATSMTIKNITKPEVEQMSNCCEQLHALAKQLRAEPLSAADQKKIQSLWSKADEKFHSILLTAARNGLLLKIAKDMHLLSRTLDVRQHGHGLYITLRSAARSYRHHAALVRAIQRRDAAGADAWIRRQLREGKERHIADVESLMVQRANSTLPPENEAISE